MRFYRLIVFISVIFLAESAFSQRIQPNRWYLTADGGISVFIGDVKRYNYVPDVKSPSELKPMFSASVGKEISRVFNVRGQFLFGGLSGHKKSANYNFSSSLFGAHALADVNLVYLLTNARYGKNRLNIWASLGGGYMHWNTTLYYDAPLNDGTDIMATSNNGNLSFPGALSFEYMLNNSLSINAQGMLYVIASDEVDAKTGGFKLDMVNYYGLGVTYKINSGRKSGKTSIDYSLDPTIYEPKPEEKVEFANVEQEEIKQTEEAIEAKTDNTGIPNNIQIEPSETEEDFPIDHELEEAAIEKELWTPRDVEAWPDIAFSVQILASKKRHNPAELQEKFNISNPIYEKVDKDSLYKYMVGKYDKLWRARETRNMVRSQNGIDGAFIVVYRDDQRISLEEAMNYTARDQLDIAKPETVNTTEAVFPLMSLVDNIPKKGVYIGVQILSVKSKEYPMGVFKGIYNIDKPIMVKYQDPWYKLIVYKFGSLQEANDYEQKLRSKGFIDTEVIIFKDGQLISIEKYKELKGSQ